MIKEIKEDKEIFELCPLKFCKETRLEPIVDEDDYVIHYFCGNCGNSWDYEDLKIPKEKIKKGQLEFWFG